MIYWLASVSLAISLLLPRVWLHRVGVFGCAIMTVGTYRHSKDWPQFVLNLACTVFHIVMLAKIWRGIDGRHSCKGKLWRIFFGRD